MAQYLLSLHTGADPGADPTADPAAPPPEPMTPERAGQLVAMEEEMKSTGAWLFSGRLTEPDVATVVRVASGDVLTTDGPFVESKEHLAGFYIVEADDLDGALGWARRTAAILGMPIEVRPFWDTSARP
jgi:hypothetical protein